VEQAREQAMALRKLAKGESDTAVVKAREYWNRTGIEVGYLEAYAFEATGSWNDWGRSTDADGGDWGFLQDLLNSGRRCQQAQWFQLIGSVGASDERAFALGAHARWTNRSPETGELLLFANDAPGFYWNNSGEIRVRITRIG
jgi:hypothetical protein